MIRWAGGWEKALRAGLVGSCAALALAAVCAPAEAQRSAGEVSSSRGSSNAVSTNLFSELADEVTQKMLASQSFLRITADGQKPRLVIGDVNNRTEDENISVGDISRKISEVLVESGTVRWFEHGTNDYDLVVNPLLSGTLLVDGKRKEYRFTLTLTLSDVQGEVKGRWSADKAYSQMSKK